MARIDRGAVLRRMARYGEAVEVLREAPDDMGRRGDRDGQVLAAQHAGDPAAVAFERANLAQLHLLLMEFDAAREHAEAAVRDTGEREEWCTPYALAAPARVRVRAGEPGGSELLARAADVAGAQADRQAMHEVRTAQAELLVRDGRPEETLTLLADGTGPGAAHLVAWAELLSGHPDRAAHRAAEETARAERAGERLSETEARTVHAAALMALGRRRKAGEEVDGAAALCARLPYPAGAHRVAQARGLRFGS